MGQILKKCFETLNHGLQLFLRRISRRSLTNPTSRGECPPNKNLDDTHGVGKKVGGYSVQMLGKKLADSHTWNEAIETLTLIHYIVMSEDHEDAIKLEIFHNVHVFFNTSHLHSYFDNSSASAVELLEWIEAYASFLKKRVCCFDILKYETGEAVPCDNDNLIEYLWRLLDLLNAFLNCKPKNRALWSNEAIKASLNLVLEEGVGLCHAVKTGIASLQEKVGNKSIPSEMEDSVGGIFGEVQLLSDGIAKFRVESMEFRIAPNLKLPPKPIYIFGNARSHEESL